MEQLIDQKQQLTAAVAWQQNLDATKAALDQQIVSRTNCHCAIEPGREQEKNSKWVKPLDAFQGIDAAVNRNSPRGGMAPCDGNDGTF